MDTKISTEVDKQTDEWMKVCGGTIRPEMTRRAIRSAIMQGFTAGLRYATDIVKEEM